MVDPGRSLLLTDLYQLTMLQGYYQQGMKQTAVFEFFVRELPEGRNFLVAAGLAQALDFLQHARFMPAELEWLRHEGRFDKEFLAWLGDWRFTGEVHALPEGTLFFPHEPILQVVAPIHEAQLVETRLINILHYQTLVATKAARMTITAPDKLLVDFGLRRAHGAEAGLFAARASYLAGFAGSSTVLAGQLYGIPIYGTMAHSFVQAHDRETAAFLHFARSQPDNAVLLIDTYDTEQGARRVVEVARILEGEGIRIKAVRLDSGDLAVLSRRVRHILDAGGFREVKIFISGDLDEYALARFMAAGAPIDGFGVGTKMVTAADQSYLNCAYKLEEYDGIPRRKKSTAKATWPGRKQVFRLVRPGGTLDHDILTLAGDSQPGTPLLGKVMAAGEVLPGQPDLHNTREHAMRELGRLPLPLRSLATATPYPVEISAALTQCVAEVDARLEG